MTRSVTVLGAASSIGIRPYDDGRMRRLDLAPDVLRECGLTQRLNARDRGNLDAPPYRDFERTPGRPRNEDEVAVYSRALAREIAAAEEDDFLLVLGGDCSIVLGCLLGLRERGERIGLAYIDAHADFASPEESYTGSAASMCLAQAVGRGDTVLARLAGDEALVRGEDAVVIARSDQDVDGRYGEEALRAMPLLDLPLDMLRERGPGDIARSALERLTGGGIDGFWIHVDADAIDPAVVPAVDSPEPGGLTLEELEALLIPLVNHPRARGMELTIYDPELDPDRTSAGQLVDLLERVLGGESAGSGRRT